ncbi:hypothetical protein [Desulfovibrio sp. JC010]|uniref:hypothetical protein n=1 Tax=Desulfovibrio sp. JC010 TaxID=2593641 RepID=UPI0013CF6F2E|nr:hypothetical protein [Desulfovibrio sp. JC010]NDV26873.1 hypothetical protein [Desulfovibrio sp. JC010]
MFQLRFRGLVDRPASKDIYLPIKNPNGNGDLLRIAIGPFATIREALKAARPLWKAGEFAEIISLPKTIKRAGKTTTSPAPTIVQTPKAVPQQSAPAIIGRSTVNTIEEKTDPLDQVIDSSSATDSGDIYDGDYIMNVILRGRIIYQGMLCQAKNNRLYIPLSELCSAVQFPIEITSGGAKGWFIRESQKFNFDAETKTVVAAQKKYQLGPEDYMDFEDEPYFSLPMINKLFDLNATANYLTLELTLTPPYMMPHETAENRKHSRFLQSKNELRYPLRDLDYAMAAPPRMQIRPQASYSKNKDTETTELDTSVLYQGDILFMTTSFFGNARITKQTGSSSKIKLNNLSITGERMFTDNPLLSKVTIGDITPVPTALGSGSGIEMGVVLSNEDLFSSSTYDTRTFSGKTIPGWDVELYNNGILVGFQTVGENGQYLFPDISLHYGNNHLKLIIYGTEGQEEVREEDILVEGGAVPPGEVTYDLSVSQQGTGVFDDEITAANPDWYPEDNNKVRVNARTAIGLPGEMLLKGNIGRDVRNGKDRVSGSVGLSGSIKSVLTEVDYTSHNTGVDIISGNAKGILPTGQNYNISAKHQISDRYDVNPLKNSIDMSISDSVKLSPESRGSYSLSASRSELSTQTYDSLSAGLGFNNPDINIHNNLSAIYYEDGTNPTTIDGSASVYKKIDKITTRGTASYTLSPGDKMGLNTVSATASTPVSEKISTSVTASKQLIDKKTLSLSNQWNYAWEPGTVFAKFTGTDQSTMSAEVGISINLGFTPGSVLPKIGSGHSFSGASCFVYLDKNYSNTFDAGDEPIEGAKVESLHNFEGALSNENGNALLYRLTPMQPTDIEVISASLPDPQMVCKTGHAITPRQGKFYELEFPVHMTGEIEGQILHIKGNVASPSRNVPLELLNAENAVIDSVYCESDGYFYFSELDPGTYSVRVAPDYLKSRLKTATVSEDIQIDPAKSAVVDTLLFYGKKEVVEATADAHRRAIMEKRDVQFFANLDDLDSPVLDSENALRPAQASTLLADKKPQKPAKRTAAATPRKIYTLIVDRFTSQKSAQRAVRHYMDRYPEALRGHPVTYKKKQGNYLVVVQNISNKATLKNIAEALLCPI